MLPHSAPSRYVITEAGVTQVETWLAEPVEAEPHGSWIEEIDGSWVAALNRPAELGIYPYQRTLRNRRAGGMNPQPLDPQDVGVGVFAAQQRSTGLTRRSVTCGLLGRVHDVCPQVVPKSSCGRRARSPRCELAVRSLAVVWAGALFILVALRPLDISSVAAPSCCARVH